MAKDEFDDFSDDDFDKLIEADDIEDNKKVPVKKQMEVKKAREPILDEAEEEDQEEEEEEEEEQPKKKVVRPIQQPQIQNPVRRPVEQPREVQREAPMPREVPRQRSTQAQPKQERYAPYIMPKRYGILDNVTGQPYVETTDMEQMTAALLSEILNKLDKIEGSL